MLVEGQTFEMGWNPSNREWYIDKGYVYTKFFDKFIVKLEDLSPSSIVEIKVACEYCETVRVETYGNYNKRHVKQGIDSDVCDVCKPLLPQLRNNTIVSVTLNIGKKIFILKCEKCLLYKEIKCFNSIPSRGKPSRNPHCSECNLIDTYEMPDRINLNSITKTSKDMNLTVDITEGDYFKILDTFNDKCSLTNDHYFITEHFIPVSWGHGGTYVGNIYPLRDSLNMSKSNRNPFNWFERKKKEINNLDEKNWKRLIKYLASCYGLGVGEFRLFVSWCEDNKRTKEEVLKDGDVRSIELWKRSRVIK